jgi:hypothetical protein
MGWSKVFPKLTQEETVWLVTLWYLQQQLSLIAGLTCIL